MSTTISLTWPKVYNYSLQITWNRVASSQCLENYTDASCENCEIFASDNQTSFLISSLKEFSKYNITACLNGSGVCDIIIVMTAETGNRLTLLFCV